MKKATESLKMDAGSYRDPTGYVFYQKTRVLRYVKPDLSNFYENIVRSNFFAKLATQKIVVETRVLEPKEKETLGQAFPPGAGIFEHAALPQISYPMEWTPSMLCDAASHTLCLQRKLLKRALSLKDATPYNIQFRGCEPVFIDLTSIETASNNGVWLAYNQFCQMFLYPLLMNRFSQMSLNSLFLGCFEGIDLEHTINALGLKPFFRLGLFLDYLVPALILKTALFSRKGKKASIDKTYDDSTRILAFTARRLGMIIRHMRPRLRESMWTRYRKTCTYTGSEYQTKMEFLDRFIKETKPGRIIDLGCNTGDFSILCARAGAGVLAIDNDLNSLESVYDQARVNGLDITPLQVNIAAPTPAMGWMNHERKSFLERCAGRFDAVLALALLHHLVVTSRVPLDQVAALLESLTRRWVVVEYVDPRDAMFQELIKYRTESYNHATQKNFEQIFSKRFKILRTIPLEDSHRNMHRCLYLLEKPNL